MTSINFKTLKRRKEHVPESTVVLFGDPKREHELSTSINRVAITGRKVQVTPRIKEYEVNFTGDKGTFL